MESPRGSKGKASAATVAQQPQTPASTSQSAAPGGGIKGALSAAVTLDCSPPAPPGAPSSSSSPSPSSSVPSSTSSQKAASVPLGLKSLKIPSSMSSTPSVSSPSGTAGAPPTALPSTSSPVASPSRWASSASWASGGGPASPMRSPSATSPHSRLTIDIPVNSIRDGFEAIIPGSAVQAHHHHQPSSPLAIAQQLQNLHQPGDVGVPMASVVPQQRLRAQQRLREAALARSSLEAPFIPHASTRAMHELMAEAGALAAELLGGGGAEEPFLSPTAASARTSSSKPVLAGTAVDASHTPLLGSSQWFLALLSGKRPETPRPRSSGGGGNPPESPPWSRPSSLETLT